MLEDGFAQIMAQLAASRQMYLTQLLRRKKKALGTKKRSHWEVCVRVRACECVCACISETPQSGGLHCALHPFCHHVAIVGSMLMSG